MQSMAQAYFSLIHWNDKLTANGALLFFHLGDGWAVLVSVNGFRAANLKLR